MIGRDRTGRELRLCAARTSPQKRVPWAASVGERAELSRLVDILREAGTPDEHER